MICNVHHYPNRLFAVLQTCVSVGALIIESRDKVQINYQGNVILSAECNQDGWLVTMGANPPTNPPTDGPAPNKNSENKAE